MKLSQKLLGYLNRVFDKDPDRFVALRIRYDGGLAWTVSDGVLTLESTGGLAPGIRTWDLEAYSLRQLAYDVAAIDGFTIAHLDAERAGLSSLVLLDGTGDQAESNGDALHGYSSLLWAIVEAWARQLQVVRDQAAQAVRQLTTKTAEGAWLDELASYYGMARMAGEVDGLFGPRIIAEAIRPLANNIAIERAIADYTGQPVEVVDVTVYLGVFPVYDGTIDHDGLYNYATVGLPNYGLFDVTVAYDLIAGGDIDTFLTTVQAIVGRLRAAGTHMRALALSSAGTPMSDEFLFAPADSTSMLSASSAFTEVFEAPTEALSTLAAVQAGMADAFTAPIDSAEGEVRRRIVDHNGAPITDENDAPILAVIGPLFD